MNCPECGISHRSIEKAYQCKAPVENEYAHYIIITKGIEGETTEENLLKFDHINLEHFRDIKSRLKAMKDYIASIEHGTKGTIVECEKCGKEFFESEYSYLCDATIFKRKRLCPECHKTSRPDDAK
jgi:hypothetical protein